MLARLRDARLDARRRGVGDRRAHRRADRERARRERDVPRHDRRVRVRREALGARRDRRAGRERGVGDADGASARSGCSAPTSGSRSPASPARPSRTASPSARCVSAMAFPGHRTVRGDDPAARRPGADPPVRDDLAAQPRAPASRRAALTTAPPWYCVRRIRLFRSTTAVAGSGGPRVRRGRAAARRARRGGQVVVARACTVPATLALPRLLGPRWTTREQWHLTLQFLGNARRSRCRGRRARDGVRAERVPTRGSADSAASR